jgi:predicted outer membrane protein
MKQRKYLTICTTLAIGALASACASNRSVAKTNGPQPETSAPVFGEPGVDFPAPFYTGARNADLDRYGPLAHKKQEPGNNAAKAVPEEGRRYRVSETQTRKTETGNIVSRDRTTHRSAAPERRMINKAPIGDLYGNVKPFPADTSVNVANLADVDLISRFHLMNLREIELGQLTAERGNSDWVRALGRRLAMDHQYADRRLMSLTRRLELTVPSTSPNLSTSSFDYLETTHLNTLSGTDFDRELLRRIQAAHDEKMQLLRSAQAELPKDSKLRDLVVTFIPIMEQHAAAARSISERHLNI